MRTLLLASLCLALLGIATEARAGDGPPAATVVTQSGSVVQPAVAVRAPTAARIPVSTAAYPGYRSRYPYYRDRCGRAGPCEPYRWQPRYYRTARYCPSWYAERCPSRCAPRRTVRPTAAPGVRVAPTVRAAPTVRTTPGVTVMPSGRGPKVGEVVGVTRRPCGAPTTAKPVETVVPAPAPAE